jgi:GT2 family glycosyltransferase
VRCCLIHKLKKWRNTHHHKEISLLVPFRADDEGRQRNWDWLRAYWETLLPEAEIIIGRDPKWRLPFSKTYAVNHAAKRAHGKYFVILDADAYLDVEAIRLAVARMKKAERNGHRLWFVPYRRLWRLTRETTEELLEGPPVVPRHYCRDEVGDFKGSLHGRRFGAMCQVMPRDAYFAAGGMDPRFRGWGGEDVSFVRAVDTMWGRHKTLDYDIYHLHHEKIGDDWRTRVWRGQTSARVNEHLASRYDRANYQTDVMQSLINEFRLRKLFFWRSRG